MREIDLSKLTKAEQKKLKDILEDPVKWAHTFLKTFDPKEKVYKPWSARWYQVEMLKDESLKKVARCGRRTGKCLPEWVKILDPSTGDRVPIGELYRRGKAQVATMTEDHKIEATSTNIVMDNGIKEVFKVRLQSGKEIDATGNHPLYTVNGWKDIDELSIGDFVATPRSLEYFGNETISDDKVKFTAYMLGDGNCTTNTMRFSNQNERVIKEITEAVEAAFGSTLIQYKYNATNDYNIVKINNRNQRNYPNKAIDFLREIGMFGKGALEKEIPEFIFRLNKKQTALFLSRLFATDGWVSSRTSPRNYFEVGYCSSSKALIQGLQHLLLKFGIRSTFKEKKVKYNGSHRISYQLCVYNKEGLHIFSQEIGVFSKEEALEKALLIAESINEKEDIIPVEIMREVDDARIAKKLMKQDLIIKPNERLRMDYQPQRKKLKQYAEVLDNKYLLDLAESDLAWEKIVSITSIGFHQTYDLTIPVTHNFVANDIIVHNTETMCVDGLFRSFKNKNHQTLIITPYENQVRLIFSRLKELIDGSPLLKDQIVKQTFSPFLIEFKNGSRILGFTTGASSGSGAASIRGQKADYLILDEMDYMGKADFDTVMTIAAERDNIGVFCSSTPTGRREKFYEICTNPKLGFTEHYHPSTHNPNWGPKMEIEFKEQLSEQGYIHEIMAEFGVEQDGVFPKDKIDLAGTHMNYAYEPLTILQKNRLIEAGKQLVDISNKNAVPPNPFRTMGIKIKPMIIQTNNPPKMVIYK